MLCRGNGWGGLGLGWVWVWDVGMWMRGALERIWGGVGRLTTWGVTNWGAYVTTWAGMGINGGCWGVVSSCWDSRSSVSLKVMVPWYWPMVWPVAGGLVRAQGRVRWRIELGTRRGRFSRDGNSRSR